MSPVVITLLGTVLPLLLMASLVPTILAQLRGPTHPTVLVSDAFTAAFVLILPALVTKMPGWVQSIWWAVLLACLLGVVASTVRLLHVPSAAQAPAQTGPLPHAGPAPRDQASSRAQPLGRGQLLRSCALGGLVLLLALLGG